MTVKAGAHGFRQILLSWSCSSALAENSFDRPEALFYQVERTTVQQEVHLLVVEAQLFQNRRLEVADVVRFFHRAIADFVSCSLDYAALNASARKQRAEAHGVVVTSCGVLRPRSASE